MEKAIIDIESLNKTVQKIEMYRTEEAIKISSIESCLNDINSFVITHNTNKLDNIKFDLITKLNTLKRIHENNITIINKNISKYVNASLQQTQIFSNIYKG